MESRRRSVHALWVLGNLVTEALASRAAVPAGIGKLQMSHRRAYGAITKHGVSVFTIGSKNDIEGFLLELQGSDWSHHKTSTIATCRAGVT
ncbi:hypothetical protein BD309DRAFT_181077 [Dichomitus squalens]|nr:hypothetical protein BD309DRAFT_181077 [Dichomitus squalens]